MKDTLFEHGFHVAVENLVRFCSHGQVPRRKAAIYIFLCCIKKPKVQKSTT